MHFDYKCTIWQRIHIKEDVTKEEILEYLEKNPNSDTDDLFAEFGTENEVLYDSNENLSVEENDNQSTIELFDETEDVPVWTNKPEEDFSEQVKETIERMEDLEENREVYKGIDNVLQDDRVIKFMHWNCTLHFDEYQQGGICIQLLNADPLGEDDFIMEPGTETIATASVWIEGLQEGEVAIKSYSENEGMLECLTRAGIVSEPKRWEQHNFVTIPICTLLKKEL